MVHLVSFNIGKTFAVSAFSVLKVQKKPLLLTIVRKTFSTLQKSAKLLYRVTFVIYGILFDLCFSLGQDDYAGIIFSMPAY